ncbi:MAG: hypothetical protein WD490_05050 [Opitutales bacterium]
MTNQRPCTIPENSIFANSGQNPTKKGSALLVTLLVISLLLFLVMAFTVYVRMKLRSIVLHQQQVMARKNAVLAMDLALAQLQLHTGPDQRVTGRADILLPPGVVIAPDEYNLDTGAMTRRGTTGAEAENLLHAWWTARNRNWVGAWQNINPRSFDPNNAPDFNPEPGLRQWLVSGNEIGAAAYNPTTPVSGLSVSSTPFDEIPDANSRVHRLLVQSAADATNSISLDRAVTAPQVDIRMQSIITGRYAWWIGDEGVKARANVVDAFAHDNGVDATLSRRQSAQRPVIEAMGGLSSLYPANDPSLHRVMSGPQFGFLSADPAFGAAFKKYYHDLTLFSQGVLANVRDGGLKADLSHILANSSAGGLRDDLRAAFRGVNVAPSPSGNPMISTASTPYAAFPDMSQYPRPDHDERLHMIPIPLNLMDHTVTWDQLWSFYNLGNRPTDSPPGVFQSDVAQARLPTRTQHGLTPIFMQGKVFYRMKISGGTVHVDINPLVVLANPYPVPLAGDFVIRINMVGNPHIRHGLPPANATTQQIFNAVRDGARPGGDLGNAYLGNITLVAKANGIPPGEARIFTVDPDADLVIVDNADSHEVAMLPSYDPTVFLTYNTGIEIPPGHFVGLFTEGNPRPIGEAFMGQRNEASRFAHIRTRESFRWGDSSGQSTFRVFPFEAVEGAKRGGGGLTFALHDGYTRPHQSPFLQLNYRSMIVRWMGLTGIAGHPLEWSIYYGFPGQRDQPYDDLPLPSYGANILLPPNAPGIPNTTRWGLVNTGDFPNLTTTPPGIDGFSDVGLVNMLYDIPRPGRPPVSLGQLQHVNLSGPAGPLDRIQSNAWQNNYAVGNSYATPRVPQDLLFVNSTYHGPHYDGTFLLNDILWDRFMFSSFPQTGAFDFDNPSDRLVNARFKPFRPHEQAARDTPSNFRGIYAAAENLLVEGAFNVNSTSVDAWKAVLSGLKNVPIGRETDAANLTAPFPRVLTPSGGARDSKRGNTENAWSGFRNLTHDEVRAIAQEMVLQVRLRGPFLSMSQFVNRRLAEGQLTQYRPPSPDVHLLGFRGALQAAIDKVINQQMDVSSDDTGVGRFSDKTHAWATAGQRAPFYGDVEFRMPNKISGFPGYLLQGDVLSALAPGLSARSDTFVIRTYGDVVAPGSTQPAARAWCEAVVQRLPDYMDPADAPGDMPSSPVNLRFGRRYHVVSFRWFTPGEI